MTRPRRGTAGPAILGKRIQNLLWTPDYSVAQSNSDAVKTGQQTGAATNTGLVFGQLWDATQPPTIRGAFQKQRVSVVRGTQVPGSRRDPYRPHGAMCVTSLPTKASTDFNVAVMQAQSATDTSVYVLAADIATRSNGEWYPDSGQPIGLGGPARTLQYFNSGDTLTKAVTGGEHIRLTAALSTNPDGSLVTSSITYPSTSAALTSPSGVVVTPGAAYDCVLVSVARGIDNAAAAAINAGDLFTVTTGEVNPVGSLYRTRVEVYNQYAANSANNAAYPPINWPDPVGSTRAYQFSIYVGQANWNDPGGVANGAYLVVTQWKGKDGGPISGSPPRALQIAPNGDGTANWNLVGTSTAGTVATWNLGLVQPGWNKFGFQYQWGVSATTGATTAYLNDQLVVDGTKTWTNGSLKGGSLATMMASSVNTPVTNLTIAFTNGSNLATVPAATGLVAGAELSGSGMPVPAGTLIRSISGTTLTLTAPASGSGAVSGLTATAPDPIYLKQGIYRSVSWTTDITLFFSPVQVGTALQ